MGQDDGVGVGVQYSDRSLGLNESLYLVQDQVPLDLILRLVCAGVIGYLGVQFTHKFSHQLHLVKQQTNDNKTRVVSQLLHHKVGPVLLRCTAVISSTSYSGVKRISLVQVTRLACTKVVMVIKLTDFARYFTDLPTFQSVLSVQDYPETIRYRRSDVESHGHGGLSTWWIPTKGFVAERNPSTNGTLFSRISEPILLYAL